MNNLCICRLFTCQKEPVLSCCKGVAAVLHEPNSNTASALQ
ncbi:hypothetical protein HMPREF3034_00855 [Prevotella sp. DNF00663]|nr:hypothetical protein HMPREF3034_00855 [Prevotella sp. DNF00663]